MKATSFRRQIIMAVLLSLAVLGGAMRHWADNPSITRDIGTLLLVMWVPAVGNLIAFLVARMPRKAPPPAGFAPGSTFVPHAQAELTPLQDGPGMPANAPDDRTCTLLIGKDGFTARLDAPLQQWLESGQTQTLDLEFLRPVVALPRFSAGTPFHVLVGVTCIGTGRIAKLFASDQIPAKHP